MYLVVAQTTMLQFTLALKSFYSKTGLHVVISQYVAAGLLSLFYLLNFPTLVPQADYSPISAADAQMDGVSYEPLAGEREVCPERKSNIFTFLLFGWMSPLMKLGYQRPLTDKDIWLLDCWDTTEKLYVTFEEAWNEERAKASPWLLRALNKSLGARFWLGGLFKIGNDAAQFVGPIFLGLLLESMQNREPVWHGYVYAASIFFGVLLGVICEGQYFQNVMRVGMRTRSTLIAAVFRKSLRLTQAGRKGFTAGKITNLMTTDAEALQQITQQLHSLWSSPLRIIIAITLLYRQVYFILFPFVDNSFLDVFIFG
jgi:ATP-binding cassette subfamily C (CFTR/MRP) protein 1